MRARLEPITVLIKLCLVILFFGNCSQKVSINDIQHPPKVVEADQALANVYQALDGKWKGNFLIYEDTARQIKKVDQLYHLDQTILDRPNLKASGNIKVEQVYTSESPFFQRVVITDYYPETKETVVSKGINKVQDGKMWCVVLKPDETVIHEGKLEGEHTIIWQRSEKSPQKVEYFYETVHSNTYEIIGWGYYEGDDLTLMPRFWFYGNYHRMERIDD